MRSLKSRYNYDPSSPVSKQYKDTEVFNAYYKCFDTESNNHRLLSHFQTKNPTQINAFYKKYTKIMNTVQQSTCKNLSTIHDVLLIDNSLYLILDWSEGGSLIEYVGKSNSVDWRLALRIISNILNGLNHLHKLELLHSFLNLQNIQVDSNGTPKLSFKCIIYKTLYLAPQFKKKHQKSKESDLFALGVCLYRLLMGIFPFKEKNVEQFINSTKSGPSFNIKKQGQLFQIQVPENVRQILNLCLNLNPQIRNKAVSKIMSFISVESSQSILHQQIYQKIFKNKYINAMTGIQSMDEYQFTILQPTQKKILKLDVIKSEQKQIQQYMKNILSKWVKLQHQSFCKIFQYQIILKEFLVIVYSYCDQGSIGQYQHNSIKRPFDAYIIEKSIGSIISAFRQYATSYKYLTNQTVLIKGGNIKIKYPNYPTREFLQKLKKTSLSNGFIAPQVLEGNDSQTCDSWSIAVLQFWMTFNQLPQFDHNNSLIINRRQMASKDQIINFYNLIDKDPTTRKDIFANSQKKSRMKTMNRKSPQKENKSIQSFSNLMATNSNIMMESCFDQKKQNKKKGNRFDAQIIGLENIKEKDDGYQKVVPQTIQKQDNFKQNVIAKFVTLGFLQKSWNKPLRVLAKCMIAIIMYLFIFYFNFFKIDGYLLGQRHMYQTQTIEIRAFSTDTTPNINYTLVTKTPITTNADFYNTTLNVLRDQYRCVLNTYSVDSDVVGVITSTGFSVYQVFGFLLAISNILLACLLIAKMDFIKICSLTNFEVKRYHPLYNWGLTMLIMSSLTSCHYLIYGGLYHLRTEPCLGKSSLPGLQFLMKDWLASWIFRFIWIYIGMLVAYILAIYLMINPIKKHHNYFYIALIVLFFVGVGCRGMGKTVNQHETAFGVCGQLLVLIVGLCMLIIDYLFSLFTKKTIVQAKNRADDLGSIDQNNKTQQYLFNFDNEKSYEKNFH